MWHFYYGAYGTFLESAAYADASGIGISDFTRAARSMSRILLDGMQDSANRISEGRFSGEQATISAIHRDLAGGQPALVQLGIDGLFSAAFISYLGRAIERGDEEQDPAAALRHIRYAPAARCPPMIPTPPPETFTKESRHYFDFRSTLEG